MAASQADATKLTEQQHGIYMQGQAMTKIVSRWLTQNVSSGMRKRHGWTTKSGGSQQSKNTLAPSLYVPFTQSIVGQSAVTQVPSYVLDALRNSIKFRRICCSWFAGSQDSQIMASNASHMAFVHILERTLAALTPYRTVVQNAKQPDSTIKREIETVANLSDSLQSYDVPDTTQTDTTTDGQGQGSTVAGNEDAVDVLEDDDATTRDSVAVYRRVCATRFLLRDVRKIEMHIEEQWSAYASGKAELSVVASVTNFAIVLVRNLEDKFYESTGIPDTWPSPAVYPEILVPADCDLSFLCPGFERSKVVYIRSDDEFDLLPSWCLARKLANELNVRVSELHVSKSVLDQMRNFENQMRTQSITTELMQNPGRQAAWAATTMPKIEMLKRQAAIDTQQYPHPFKLGPLGDILKAEEQFWPYDQAMLQTLLGTFIDSFSRCDAEHSCHSFMEDMVLTEIRMAVCDNYVYLSTAFAIKVFAIIHTTTQQTASKRHFEEIQKAASNLATNVSASNAQLRRVSGASASRDALLQQMNIRRQLALNILHGKQSVQQLSVTKDNLDEHNWYPVQKNIHQLLRNSPLACGTLKTDLQHQNRCLTLGAVDHRGTVRSALHFYNVALQRGELRTKWEEMEQLINTHTEKRLFLHQRPKSLEEALSVHRIVFGMKFDLGDIYRGRGKITTAPGTKGLFFSTDDTPTYQLLRRLFQGMSLSQRLRVSFADIEIVLKTVQQDSPLRPKFTPQFSLENRDQLQKSLVRTRPFGALEMLEAAQHCLTIDHSTNNHSVDILHLERQCWDLLSALEANYTTGELLEYGQRKDMRMIPTHGIEYKEHRYLTMPLVWLAVGTDGKTKEMNERCERKGSEEEKEKMRAEVERMRRPYDVTVRAMEGFIGRVGERSVGVWVRVGNARMLDLR